MKKKRFSLSIIIVGCLFACQTSRTGVINHTYNPGGYTLSVSKNSSNEFMVYGFVRDIQTKKTISQAVVKFGCLVAKTDNEGFYSMKTRVSSEQAFQGFIEATFIGYRSVETARFNLAKGDSTNIDFYLIQDDRPFIHCDEIFKPIN